MSKNLAILKSEHLSLPPNCSKNMPLMGVFSDSSLFIRYPDLIIEGDETEESPMTNDIPPILPPLLLEVGNEWDRRASLAEASNIIQNILSCNSSFLNSLKGIFPIQHSIEWAVVTQPLEVTDTEIFPIVNKLSEETIEFIEQHHLREGVDWLQIVTPDIFPGVNFEIELLSGEDEEENMLALRVYGSFSNSDFRERRHAMCRAMRENDHRNLYDVISIFQRRICIDGRQLVSWYSSLAAE